jgi:hypothetical protein
LRLRKTLNGRDDRCGELLKTPNGALRSGNFHPGIAFVSSSCNSVAILSLTGAALR